MKELWKDMLGFEGLYKVSNLGNIIGKGRWNKWEDMAQFINKKGYASVSLWKDGKHFSFRVARLVCSHFVSGYKPGLCVNHMDCNKSNNSYINLEWVTTRENILHSIANKLRTPAKYLKKFKSNKSGKVGVSYENRRSMWKVYIRGKSLGYYKNKEEAIKARIKSELLYDKGGR